jgi:O-antigen/teichoic acid export membrane protein
MLVNIFYTKKLNIKREKIGVGVGFKKGLRMAKPGLFMVVNSFMATGTMLVIRSFISNHSGISEVGLFQAMWTVSTSFVGIVLNAMLTDFFPRLSGISTDNSSMNRLTNEQCEITLILGSPILIALLAFSRIVVSILYSGDFIRAIPLLQWLNAASFITLISWPVGVIFLAKGKGSFSVLLDTIGSICFIVIGVVLWRQVGILAFGISALVRAFLNIIVAFLLGRKASGFSYSWKYLRLLTLFFIPFALGFIFQLIRVKYLSDAVAYIAFIFTCVVAYLELAKRVNLKSFLSRYLPIKKNV